MCHLASGGSAPPQNWWAHLPASSPLLASLSPTVSTSVFFSPALLVPLLLTVALTVFLVFFFYRYDTVASFIHPTMAVDPQADFVGDIKVNNNPPTKATLEKVADLPVLDANKKSRTFKSLYADNEDGPRRVLICFIRHFFCGVRPPFSPLHKQSSLPLTNISPNRTAKNTSAPSQPPSAPPPSPPSHPQPQS